MSDSPAGDALFRLHAITNQLALVDNTDELCRQAVLLGTAKLGFERLGIWLMDAKTGRMSGTYGTDEQGHLRDERAWRIEPKASWSICRDLQRDVPFNFYEKVVAYDPEGRFVGSGSRALAGLWDGTSILGFLSADNFLTHQPITQLQCELMGLYAASIGHLFSRLRASQELRAREEQLRQVQKMEALGRMAGGIAHDFNNILTAILGNADLIAHVAKDDNIREYAQEIHSAGDMASQMSQHLLDFSRKQALNMKVLDVNAAVRGVAGMLERTVGKGITVVTDLTGDAARVEADATGLNQIVLNLAVNARDAMPAGGTLTIATARVHVGPESMSGLPSGDYVRVSVRDTGSGMAEEAKKRLFEPFFTTKAKGTGFGLSIVFNLVTQFRGRIEVESSPGKGTEFCIFLPEVAAQAS